MTPYQHVTVEEADRLIFDLGWLETIRRHSRKFIVDIGLTVKDYVKLREFFAHRGHPRCGDLKFWDAFRGRLRPPRAKRAK